MKKNIVLAVLFIMPLAAYMFFATGVNRFMTLPTLTETIPNIGNWKTINGKSETLDKKITILGFSGNDIEINKGNYFNLNQKIYSKNKAFKDFQFVIIAPIGTEAKTEKIIKELSALDDMSHWHFVFASTSEISEYYSKLHLQGKLNSDFGSKLVYIIDKKRNLRGRKGIDPNDKTKSEYQEGYDASSPADLYNKMADDVKVILAEYRLALKRNNADRQI
jgi:hypothetical protein